MRITGYKLMDRLEELKEQAKTVDSQFKGALFQFRDERGEKLDPRVLMQTYESCEASIAALQEAQAAYNLKVQVTVQDETMSLHLAVKRIGGVNHVKNQWKSAAQDSEINPYMRDVRSRDKDSEYAERVVGVEEALRLSDTASRRAAALKQAIRSGNAVEVDLDLDPTLFE
jgi:hypothetical protein